MNKQLQPGTYVEDVECMRAHPDGRMPIRSSHKVGKEDDLVVNALAEAFNGIAQKARVNRIQATLAGLQNVYGAKLDNKTLESRAEMIMRYKDVRPIWVREKSTSNWERFKACLDFNAPDMHARILDDDNNIHVFDPGAYHFCTKSERIQWIIESRMGKQKTEINALRTKSRDLKGHARYLEQRADALEEENSRIHRLYRQLCRENKQRKEI